MQWETEAVLFFFAKTGFYIGQGLERSLQMNLGEEMKKAEVTEKMNRDESMWV